MDQTSPRRRAGCANALFFVGVIVLTGVIAWGWYQSLPKPGQHFTLAAPPPEKLVFVMVNKDAALDFKKFTTAGDAIGLKQLLAGGKVLRVPVGETVLIIDHDWINSLYEVRVRSGTFAGARGWVVREGLKEIRDKRSQNPLNPSSGPRLIGALTEALTGFGNGF